MSVGTWRYRFFFQNVNTKNSQQIYTGIWYLISYQHIQRHLYIAHPISLLILHFREITDTHNFFGQTTRQRKVRYAPQMDQRYECITYERKWIAERMIPSLGKHNTAKTQRKIEKDEAHSLSRYVFSLLRVPSVCAAVICYSPASSTCSSFVFCILPHLGIPFVYLFSMFRTWYLVSQSLFLGWRVCCALVTRYVSTWFAYEYIPWFIRDFCFLFFSVSSHCYLWPQKLYFSYRRMNQDGHWVYCWCRWVERTV